MAFHAGQGLTKDIKPPKLEVYDPKGNRVFKKLVVHGNRWMGLGLKPGSSKRYRLDWSKKNGGYGTYTIVWRAGGVTETAKFEIVPASERLEKK